MIKLARILLLVLFPVELIAQLDSSRADPWKIGKFYGSVGLVVADPGTFFKGASGLHFKNKWGVAIDGMFSYYKAKRTPVGYKTGFCLFGDCSPKDKLQIFSVQPFREINLHDKHSTIIVGAGPSFIVYDELQFKRASSGSFGTFFEGSNYDTFTDLHRTLGLSVHTKFLFRPLRHFAIGLGWFSNFNKYKGVHGIEINITAGRL